VISADLHLHTCYSHDCATQLKDVVRRCREAGLDCVAVTDHNTIAGALRLRDSGEFRVIVGEEISTGEGEMLGLFLTEAIPRGLTALDTIERVQAQGGLTCIPHPLGRRPFFSSGEMGFRCDGRFKPAPGLKHANKLLTEDVLARVDMLEAINSRTPFSSTWDAMRRLVEVCGLPATAGSDAHSAQEIGHARVVMDDFHDAQSFLAAIRDGQVSGSRSSHLVHFQSIRARLRRRACSD